MIHAVIFDCFGVLTTDTWKAYLDNLPTDIDKPILKDLNHQLDAGLISLDDFVQGVFEITGTKPALVEKLLNNEAAKNDNLLDYIRQLKEQGMKTAILSNVSSNWVKEIFLSEEERQLFDVMIFSFEVHMTKPDPGIFELAAERLGVAPEDCIFIDDAEWNCRGAESIGMKSVIYTDFGSTKSQISKLLTDSNK